MDWSMDSLLSALMTVVHICTALCSLELWEYWVIQPPGEGSKHQENQGVQVQVICGWTHHALTPGNYSQKPVLNFPDLSELNWTCNIR